MMLNVILESIVFCYFYCTYISKMEMSIVPQKSGNGVAVIEFSIVAK